MQYTNEISMASSGSATVKGEGEITTAIKRLESAVNRLVGYSENLTPLINHGKPMAGCSPTTDKSLCEIASCIDNQTDRVEGVITLISSVEI